MQYETLSEFVNYASFTMFLVFCRTGVVIMLFPGLGETYVSMRIRLIFALFFAAMLSPMLQDQVPLMPNSLSQMFLVILYELFIGLFFGVIIRLLLSITHITGMIIAMQSALSAATLFDANQGAQGAIIGNLFSSILIVLMFATNMHHLFFSGIIDSYIVFKPGQFIGDEFAISSNEDFYSMVADMTYSVVQIFNDSFKVAFKIAAPIIVTGLIMFLAGGILARLMPQIQIFFIITPAQMLLSFVIIMLTLTVSMNIYLEHITETIVGIFNFEY